MSSAGCGEVCVELFINFGGLGGGGGGQGVLLFSCNAQSCIGFEHLVWLVAVACTCTLKAFSVIFLFIFLNSILFNALTPVAFEEEDGTSEFCLRFIV